MKATAKVISIDNYRRIFGRSPEFGAAKAKVFRFWNKIELPLFYCFLGANFAGIMIIGYLLTIYR